MSKEVSSEATKKRTRNNVEEGTSNDINREETYHMSLFDLSSEIIGNVSTYLSMPDITNFTLVIGCVALRDTSLRNNNNTSYVDAVRRTTLENNSGYLVYVFLGLPGHGIYSKYHQAREKYVNVADKVRMWMEHNKEWESRVQCAMSSDSWSHEDNPLVRKVTVSERDQKAFNNDGPTEFKYSLSEGTNCASLVQEQGNLLVGVEDTNVTIATDYSLEDIISESMECLSEEEDEIGHVDLYFMNCGDAMLNHPTLILKLGLVDVLKVMVEKGFIHSMDVISWLGPLENDYLDYPLLWRAYFHSPDDSCFDYLLSRPESDCSRLVNNEILLHCASSYVESQNYIAGNRYHINVKLPIGVAAYRKLAQHSTTDVNAESIHYHLNSFDTALHDVLHDLQKGANNSDVIRQIRILMEAGANPNQHNPIRGTAMEYFQSICDRESRGRKEDRIFDNDCEEIEYAFRNATFPVQQY